MNKEWSEKIKRIQVLLDKETTYKDAIELLIEFRKEMFEQISQIVNGYPAKAFYQMPFANTEGYHSKTLAYSIWHIFRIEDIVAHSLIAGDEQILMTGDYQKKIGSPIITTGNELQGQEIAEFSKKLNIKYLYEYAREVMLSTNSILLNLEYSQMKTRYSVEDKDKLASIGCVSPNENAIWLIDYWCNKDIRGLIKMPFSRHWSMHIEAMKRIKNKLCKNVRKGVDPVAYCGLSCNHCFLGEWCGSCRTEYNVCSFATIYEDRRCPNMVCCMDKKIDGCYECSDLENCTKGFYMPDNDGAASAKAQAMFIRKYGKKAFLKTHDKLHERYDFSKTQEILGQDVYEGFKLLEKEYSN
ncbi:DUF3795 domain-containing protein [Lachnospiraceae bacterium MD1]|jgi:hypothetical protein|uniref:DUF3795 domain-containing protein n=1 Tax=Variimorphobacter saccharofermentans TaxID=2755051 RepID=A0A839K1G3_9FIRM|nr:DUF3795 domain-containing protein [Variimorphobacter saccharofermentans]